MTARRSDKPGTIYPPRALTLDFVARISLNTEVVRSRAADFLGRIMMIGWHVLVVSLSAAVASAQARAPVEPSDPTRAARIAVLRAQAKEHIEQERALYTEEQLRDIKARYRAAHQESYPMFLRREAAPILRDLVAAYPRSNRAGCAVLDLAHLASGEARERYLKEAIADHSDAWCESGVQVGGLARARLAVHYVWLERFDEAERLAEEVQSMFPGAIDESGAPLEDVLKAVKLLRH